MARIFAFGDVRVAASASVVGREENRGPLGDLFDFHDDENRFGAKTWEQAEGEASRMALSFALKKWNSPAPPELLFAGDLQNQCMASASGLLSFGIPYFGLYGACSTMTEGLLLASIALASGGVRSAAAVSSSHNAAAERQFRLPLEYGGQRTPTAQWTATAAGAFVLEKGEGGVRITHGMAVAVGMVMMARAGEMHGVTEAGTAERIVRLCEKYGLPTSDSAALSDIAEAAKGDKKTAGSNINLVLLRKLGESFIHPLPVSELEAFLTQPSTGTIA